MAKEDLAHGILRDRTIVKMAPPELSDLLDVHVVGAFSVVAPAFRFMKENGGGRFVITVSPADNCTLRLLMPAFFKRNFALSGSKVRSERLW